ncbi:acyltransferase [Bacillus sp. AFS037270]|uniref:acyltransferase family protein n=1 Tax=Bacillus sp. AFS037270 TaxID=2033499 RepID=UPI000BFD97C3|nr:acyltransferase [Bacillus sp. AFS037270]PGV53358.1 acyltransferase [Bacillus sp. AFS037270]
MKRYDELDSLRGLAALSVVIYHALNLTITNWSEINNIIWRLCMYSPLRLLWSGHQSVILFFVLSGFVLSLPFYRTKVDSTFYFQYLIKRICRIYIPFAISIGAAILTRIYLTGTVNLEGLWIGQISWKPILQHLFLIDMFNQNYFNPVVWSLVHEMRISIIFPIIIAVILKYNWKNVLTCSWILSVLAIVMHYLFQDKVDITTNYFDTFHYILMFVVGSLMAKHKENLIRLYNSVKLNLKYGVLLLGYCLYAYSIGIHIPFFGRYIGDWFTTLGSMLIITTVISGSLLSKPLLLKPIVFIGKISYSVYLSHLIIFLALTNNFLGKWTNSEIWIVGLLLTFIISTISYYSIEINSMKLGKNLANRVTKRKTVQNNTEMSA